jgi:hypothetical protein
VSWGADEVDDFSGDSQVMEWSREFEYNSQNHFKAFKKCTDQ